jgi:hypothetical protein
MASRSFYWVSTGTFHPACFLPPAIADTRRFGAGVAYSNVSLFWNSHNKPSTQADDIVQLLSKPLHPTWYQGPPILANVNLGLVEI